MAGPTGIAPTPPQTRGRSSNKMIGIIAAIVVVLLVGAMMIWGASKLLGTKKVVGNPLGDKYPIATVSPISPPTTVAVNNPPPGGITVQPGGTLIVNHGGNAQATAQSNGGSAGPLVVNPLPGTGGPSPWAQNYGNNRGTMPGAAIAVAPGP